MPLGLDSLPVATDYDPTEDPPGSIDPLGTLAYAELLADVIFPGFTARMFRPRLLTMAVVAAAVAERAVEELGGREDLRLEARLAFERLAAFALARAGQQDAAEYGGRATRRLPGVRLARGALRAGEPLTRQSFLRGQAVNGASGVVMRLARHVGLLDDRARLARFGQELLLEWAEDEKLLGVLDGPQGVRREGHAWMRRTVKATVASVSSREWPGSSDGLWDRLAEHLRLDRLRVRERGALIGRLRADETRARILDLLESDTAVAEYRSAQPQGRNVCERATLVRAVKPLLSQAPVDAVVRRTIDTLEAYERVSGLLQQAFDGLSWGLKRTGGRASPDRLGADAVLSRHFERTRRGLLKAAPLLDAAIEDVRGTAPLSKTEIIGPLCEIRDEAVQAGQSARQMLDVIMNRHERVQKRKGKGVWIERDDSWTLMPGFGVDGDTVPSYDEQYLHPVRVQNAYSFLADLGRVKIRVDDGKTD